MTLPHASQSDIRSLYPVNHSARRGAICSRYERVDKYKAIHWSSHPVAAVLLCLLAMGSIYETPAVAQDGQSPQHPGSIHGTVINAVTGEPIGHALVFTTDNRFGRLTDSDGHFDYPIPKAVGDDTSLVGIAGRDQPQFSFCCIQARKPGFLSDPNEDADGQISLGSEHVIALIPEGLIKGRVSLPSSEAASGMVVELFSRQVQDGTFRWIRNPPVHTNSNGEFRFAELLPGDYKIVTHELMDTPSAMLGRPLYGFPPVYFPGAVDLTSATPIHLSAGTTFEADLSPVRQPYYPVHIPVAGEVENAAITVSIQGNDSPGYSLSYLSDRHSIDGFLPNGTYLVSMQSFEPNGASGASGTVILTVSGGPAQGSKVVLSRHSSIQLNVSEEFNSKDWNQTGSWSHGKHSFEVHGPRLYLQASVEPVDDLDFQRGRSIRPPTGPDDDSLVIEDVPPGRYRVRLFASRGYVASATAGGVDLLQEPLVITPGNSPTVDINLRDDFAAIDGSLTSQSAPLDTSAKPGHSGSWKSRACIYFIPQPGSTGQYQQIVVAGEGRFDLANVAPGKYLVLAFEKQQMNLPYRDVEAMRAYEPKGQMIQLVPGQKEKLELQIISGTE